MPTWVSAALAAAVLQWSPATAQEEPAEVALLEYLGTFEPGDESTVDALVGMAEAEQGEQEQAPAPRPQEENGDDDA